MPEMILAFVLTVYIDEQQQPNPQAFYDVNRCLYFAKRIRQQGADYRWKKYSSPVISATCVPKLVDKNSRIWK